MSLKVASTVITGLLLDSTKKINIFSKLLNCACIYTYKEQLNANLTPVGKQPTRIGIFARACRCIYRHTHMPQVTC